MTHNDRTSECETRANGVHHAGPVAELRLFGRVTAAEYESNGCWRKTDNGTGDGTKEDAVANCRALV